ncbi:aldo/keto reductase [Kribbella sp. NPDC051952]|uniref:aldo/keto reductase n=1 Tax=Kribbella sp. NPDC051952 TaxID=3154851 RepID=UPI00341FBF96
MQRIGFGTKRLAGNAGDRPGVREHAVELLRRAIELGVNHLDTADFYPSYAPPGSPAGEFEPLGWAKDAIREALAPYGDDLVIATKVGPTKAGMCRPDELRALVEADLQALGLETLDLVYLRQAGLPSVAEHFGVLAELQAKGMIRHLGLASIRAEQLAQAQEIAPVVAVQNRYGVGYGRVNDGILQTCGEQGIAFVPYFALTAESRETGGVSINDVIQEIADRHGATPAQIRLAWTLSRGDHVLAIPGTSSQLHLEENLEAGSIRLSPEERTVLDSVTD